MEGRQESLLIIHEFREEGRKGELVGTKAKKERKGEKTAKPVAPPF